MSDRDSEFALRRLNAVPSPVGRVRFEGAVARRTGMPFYVGPSRDYCCDDLNRKGPE